MKKRSDIIRAKIKELKAQVNDLERELVLVERKEREKSQIFKRLPTRIQNVFGNYETLVLYICGNLDNPEKEIIGLSSIHLKKAQTPYQRLMAIHGVGESMTLETLRVLGLD